MKHHYKRLGIGLILAYFMGLSALCPAQERISKGDILEIRVFGREDLSKTLMVQADGTVDYPFVSDVPIDGLGLDEFRDLVASQVSKYLGERAIVTVRFSQTLSVRVVVLGQVVVPGEYLVPKNATVQGAVTMAGGFTPRAQIERIRIHREAGESSVLDVNMQQFFLTGDPALLPSLEEGDRIVVPGLPGSYDVKVIGEVRDPGSYTVFTGANLLDVLYMAGGPNENANLKKARLISPEGEGNREIRINIDRMLKTQSLEDIPEVKPGDVVYIPRGKSAWRTFMDIVRDLSALAWPIVMILYYARLA